MVLLPFEAVLHLGTGSTERNCRLRDGKEVDDEDERLARGDHPARAAVAVGELGRDREPAAAADLHARDALIPALDDVAAAEAERERAAPVPGGVELLAVRPRDADVVNLDLPAGRGLLAIAVDEILD